MRFKNYQHATIKFPCGKRILAMTCNVSKCGKSVCTGFGTFYDFGDGVFRWCINKSITLHPRQPTDVRVLRPRCRCMEYCGRMH